MAHEPQPSAGAAGAATGVGSTGVNNEGTGGGLGLSGNGAGSVCVPGGVGAIPPPANLPGSAMTGSTTSPTDPSCQVGAAPFQCGGANGPTRAPENALLVDFVSYLAAGTWGDSSVGQLTGGSSLYSGNPASALRASSERGTLHLEANISARGYAGIVLWTGPCIDASMYDGLRFNLAGSLGGAVLQFKVQTNVNYPVSVGGVNKGACAYQTCEGRWGECVPPFAAITSVAAAPERLLRWADFSGGLPTPGLAPGNDQIVGLELQLQCQSSTDCAVDLNLGSIVFDQPLLPG